MEIRQLQYVIEIIRAGNHLSAAAESLHVSQSAVSRAIHQLEKELGFQIFHRTRNRVVGVTEAGQEVVAIAKRIVADAEAIGTLRANFSSPDSGRLTIATTHTFAIYVLPPVIEKFVNMYPKVQVSLSQGDPRSICEMVAEREADLAIGTDVLSVPDGLLNFACYTMNRAIIAPMGHPILSVQPLTLEDVAKYPLITYGMNYSGRWKVLQSFKDAGLTPDIALRVTDADVCRTYVRMGLGLGILTRAAVDTKRDPDLGVRDASHLFASSTAFLRIRRSTFLPQYTLDFIQTFAPPLTPSLVRDVQRDGTITDYDVTGQVASLNR